MHHTSRRMSNQKVADELGAVLGRQDAWKQRQAEELAAWTQENQMHWSEELAAKWDAAKRRQAEKKGDALPGGRFPIVDQEDMNNAAELAGKSTLPKATVVAHMRKQAKKHGLKVPDSLQSK